MGIAGWANAFLAACGMLFIFWKTGEWLAELLARQWCKRRRESRRQKAVNELYDAFELEKIKPDGMMKITAINGLVIMMYRQKQE